MGYVYYNPNPNALRVGDCTVRAISNDYIMGASRHNKEDVKMELYKLMQDTDDENVKDMLQSFIREMEN